MNRKPTKIFPTQRRLAAAGHLKKEELDRVNGLRDKLIATRGKPRPDIESTLELMYMRILGQVKNRAPVAADLKQLKQLLDQAGAKMTAILDEAEKQSKSK